MVLGRVKCSRLRLKCCVVCMMMSILKVPCPLFETHIYLVQQGRWGSLAREAASRDRGPWGTSINSCVAYTDALPRVYKRKKPVCYMSMAPA